MATINVEKEILQTVARQLLALAADPNDVNFTHGPDGFQFIVPDELAEAWVSDWESTNVPASAAPKKKGK